MNDSVIFLSSRLEINCPGIVADIILFYFYSICLDVFVCWNNPIDIINMTVFLFFPRLAVLSYGVAATVIDTSLPSSSVTCYLTR